MKKENKENPLKLRKGQKCWLCKKETKGEWAYNGHYWHLRCKEKDTNKRIRNYLKNIETQTNPIRIRMSIQGQSIKPQIGK